MTPKLAIVVSDFNQDITHALLHGAMETLNAAGFSKDKLYIVHVPGAVEIPITAKWLAETKHYQAIIALGAVIRGDTNHYDYVCQQVSAGCLQVSLASNLPVIFGVLTTENEEQAQERIGGKMGHKGKEAAQAALTMLTLHSQIRKNHE